MLPDATYGSILPYVDKFDLIVIGAGPGGYIAAIRASQLGLKVACVESFKKLGGTCLNIGCVPSKALLDSSEKFYELKHFADHGIKLSDPKLDLKTMMDRKNKVVERLTGGIEGLFKKNKITRIEGRGKILKFDGSTHKLEVELAGQKQIIEAKNVILATGSVPSKIPFLPVDEKTIVTSTGALTFEEVPSHLLVVGGGYIGLEMGSVWARLGAKVTVIEFSEVLLPSMDQELVRDFKRSIEAQGLTLKLGFKCTALEQKKGKVFLSVESTKDEKEILEGTHVLVSVGRSPFSEGLGLEDAGIERDPHGFVKVNDSFETNVKGVYAIGDLIGGAMLAHKAEEEGVVVAELLAGKKSSIDYALVPGVIYTDPELASIGFTEEELKTKNVPYIKGSFPFLANARAIGMAKMGGKVKVLAHANTHKILGMHILGAHASSLIGEGVMAMNKRATLEDLAHACHPHPTLTEAIKEAALTALGRALNI